MALDDNVKKAWQDIQKNHSIPVNAIGVPIKSNDSEALKVWTEEGIDAFMKG